MCDDIRWTRMFLVRDLWRALVIRVVSFLARKKLILVTENMYKRWHKFQAVDPLTSNVLTINAETVTEIRM
jgi:hypothetical protein